jgi:hypothetical protein
MKNLICDTNVFYNLGCGELKLEQVAGKGDVLWYSPVSVLEITSKIAEKSYEQRKAAAQAILASGAKQLLDPESFLTNLFGNELSEEPFDWSHAVKAVSQSADLPALLGGVPDYLDRVSRRVSVEAAGSWRAVNEQQWRDDMLKIMEDTIPGFRAWYALGAEKRKDKSKPHLTGEREALFLADSSSEEWMMTLVKACQDRSFFKAKRPKAFVPTTAFAKKLVAAVDGVMGYCLVYTHYLIKLMTEGMMPQMNDSGDLELFLYSTSDDWVVATSEKRWIDIATRAGLPDRVKKVS